MKKFTEGELVSIYTQLVKKNDHYFNRYSSMPNCPVRNWNYNWRGHDMPRNFTILDFIEWTNKHNIRVGDELGITCASDPELSFLSYKNTTLLEYPPYDLHNYYDEFYDKFDFLIFNCAELDPPFASC